jgi:single-strand DNA-binding protein
MMNNNKTPLLGINTKLGEINLGEDFIKTGDKKMSYSTTIHKGYMNRSTIIGGLKEVPELKDTKSGHVANASFATVVEIKNSETGEYQEYTEWHDVALFGKFAKMIAAIGRPGMKFFVEGPKQARSYTTKDGQTKRVVEIVATEFKPMSAIISNEGEIPLS